MELCSELLAKLSHKKKVFKKKYIYGWSSPANLIILKVGFVVFCLGALLASGGQEETVNEKYSFLWLSNRSDRHRSCPVCRRQVTGASDSWVVSDAPTEDDIATYILNMVDEVGQPHRPWHWPQADNSTWSTQSFCFHKYLFLPLRCCSSSLSFASLLGCCASMLFF